MLDDEVGAAPQRDILGKERLDLLRDVEVVENRHVALVELDDFHHRGVDELDVVANLVVHRLVVDGNLREGVVKRIADNRVGSAHLAHELGRNRLRILADGRHGLAPAVNLRLDVVFDVLILGLHGRRTDDDAEVLGQHGGGNPLQALLFVGRADFLREEDLRREGDQHHVAASQRDVRRQTRTLGRDGLLGHLDHDALSDLQIARDFAVLVERRLEFHRLGAQPPLAGLLRFDHLLERGELRSQVEVVDEGILFVPYVDECRVETRHDFTHPSQIDVAYGEARLALLLVELDQHLVLAQGNGYLRRVNVND